MANTGYPTIGTPTSMNASGFTQLNEYFKEQIQQILNSPVWRGRPGDNLSSITVEKFNEYVADRNVIDDINKLYLYDVIKKFLSMTIGYDDTDLTDDTILNKRLIIVNEDSDNSLPQVINADPMSFVYDSKQYILYIIYDNDKQFTYRLVCNTPVIDGDGELKTFAYMQSFIKGVPSTIQTIPYSSGKVKGENATTNTAYTYKLGVGLVFSKPHDNEEDTQYVWSQLSIPVIYELKYNSLDGGEWVMMQGEEGSQNVRYILNVQVIENNHKDTYNFEYQYNILQSQTFANNLMNCTLNTILVDTIANECGFGSDNSFKTYCQNWIQQIIDGSTYERTKESDAEDSPTSNYNIKMYKSIKYTDVILYEKSDDMSKGPSASSENSNNGWVNYNSGLFKTAWEAYHRVNWPEGIGDGIGVKTSFDSVKSYHFYDVALNACWEEARKYRTNILECEAGSLIPDDGAESGDVLSSYRNMMDGQTDCDYTQPYDVAKLFMKPEKGCEKIPTALFIDFNNIYNNAQRFIVNTSHEINLTTSGPLRINSQELNINKYAEDPCVVGYGGKAHGDHVFGMSRDLLFTWMHAPGDMVLVDSQDEPTWASVDGVDANNEPMKCWEKYDMTSNVALSFGNTTNGIKIASPDNIKNTIKNMIPPMWMTSATWDSGSKVNCISRDVLDAQKRSGFQFLVYGSNDMGFVNSQKTRKAFSENLNNGLWFTHGVNSIRTVKYPDDFYSGWTPPADKANVKKPTDFNTSTPYMWMYNSTNILNYYDFSGGTPIDYITVNVTNGENTDVYKINVSDIDFSQLQTCNPYITETISLTVIPIIDDEEKPAVTKSIPRTSIIRSLDRVIISTESDVNNIKPTNSYYVYTVSYDTDGEYAWWVYKMTTITGNGKTITISGGGRDTDKHTLSSKQYVYKIVENSAANISYDDLTDGHKVYMGDGTITGWVYEPYIFASSANNMINQYVIKGYKRTVASILFKCDTGEPTANPAPYLPSTSGGGGGTSSSDINDLKNQLNLLKAELNDIKNNMSPTPTPTPTPTPEPEEKLPAVVDIKHLYDNLDSYTNSLKTYYYGSQNNDNAYTKLESFTLTKFTYGKTQYTCNITCNNTFVGYAAVNNTILPIWKVEGSGSCNGSQINVSTFFTPGYFKNGTWRIRYAVSKPSNMLSVKVKITSYKIDIIPYTGNTFDKYLLYGLEPFDKQVPGLSGNVDIHYGTYGADNTTKIIDALTTTNNPTLLMNSLGAEYETWKKLGNDDRVK